MDGYKYMAIVEWSKKYIASKNLHPNDRFLSENELCSIHGVSRQTPRWGSHFVRDRFNGETPMHGHRFMTLESRSRYSESNG